MASFPVPVCIGRVTTATATTARGFSTHVRSAATTWESGQTFTCMRRSHRYIQITRGDRRFTGFYRNTRYVITITNYLATTASHFTQINKGYPLDKDGGRAGVTHYAHAVGSALRAHRRAPPARDGGSTKHRNAVSGTRSRLFPRRPIPMRRLTRHTPRCMYSCIRTPRALASNASSYGVITWRRTESNRDLTPNSDCPTPIRMRDVCVARARACAHMKGRVHVCYVVCY